MSLNPQPIIDAFRRIAVAAGSPSADADEFRVWLGSLPAEVAALVPSPRASVAQAGAFTLADADARAVDECSGTYTVTVPAASTLGDPWAYEAIVASGTVTFTGGSASVPVAASGGGTPVRLYVANGKVYLRSGSGATVTRVA